MWQVTLRSSVTDLYIKSYTYLYFFYLYHVDEEVEEAPLRTDFTDTRTALGPFSVSVFFLVFSYRYFLPFKFFCLRSLISPITVFFLIFIFYFLFHLKHVLLSFTSCARLNWQLACQFSSAINISYRIVTNL